MTRGCQASGPLPDRATKRSRSGASTAAPGAVSTMQPSAAKAALNAASGSPFASPFRGAASPISPSTCAGSWARLSASPVTRRPAGRASLHGWCGAPPAVDEDQGRSLHGVEGARAERGIVGWLRCGRGREFERGEGGETGVFPGLHAGARQPVGRCGAGPPRGARRATAGHRPAAAAAGPPRVPDSRRGWCAGRAWPGASAQAAALGSRPKPA